MNHNMHHVYKSCHKAKTIRHQIVGDSRHLFIAAINCCASIYLCTIFFSFFLSIGGCSYYRNTQLLNTASSIMNTSPTTTAKPFKTQSRFHAKLCQFLSRLFQILKISVFCISFFFCILFFFNKN